MGSFEYLKFGKKKWVVHAPKRARRPDAADTSHSPLVCPFCIGIEKTGTEIARIGGERGDDKWQVLAVPNKYPFARVHEIIIHSPDHHKNFDELPQEQSGLIFEMYKQRYNSLRGQGQVYIFHNRGEEAGESLPHPHTQIAVVGEEVEIDSPPLENMSLENEEKASFKLFDIYCPGSSQWPDEAWIVPQRRGTSFGDATDDETGQASLLLRQLIEVMSQRHGLEFPFNFYIYPGQDWYLRFIPRTKILGGFEAGAGIFVNTGDPSETLAFLRDKLVF